MEGNGAGHIPVKDIYSPQEIAGLLHISKNRVYALAWRDDDPLPLRRMQGAKRGMFAFRRDLLLWAMRNSELVAAFR